MNEELIWKLSYLERQNKEVEENLSYIESQISEMTKFKDDLHFLVNSNEKELISSIGRGVHVKTDLSEKKLFVEVGAGIIVRKNPEQTLEVIESQIKRLKLARLQLVEHLESFNQEIQKLVKEAEKSINKQ